MRLTIAGMYGPYPKKGDGADSCYLLQGEKTNLVLDMGPGSLSKLQNIIDINKIDYIFLSHLHFDHTSDFLTFRYLLEDLNHSVKLLARKIDSPWYDILVDHPLIEVINFDENTVLDLGDLVLSFFPMKHTVPCDAVRIEEKKSGKVFVYTGDTMWNENIETATDGANFILADAAKPVGFMGPHMNYKNAIEIQEKTGAFFVATHLNVDYSPENELADYDKIDVAKEFASYDI